MREIFVYIGDGNDSWLKGKVSEYKVIEEEIEAIESASKPSRLSNFAEAVVAMVMLGFMVFGILSLLSIWAHGWDWERFV